MDLGRKSVAALANVPECLDYLAELHATVFDERSGTQQPLPDALCDANVDCSNCLTTPANRPVSAETALSICWRAVAMCRAQMGMTCSHFGANSEATCMDIPVLAPEMPRPPKLYRDWPWIFTCVAPVARARIRTKKFVGVCPWGVETHAKQHRAGEKPVDCAMRIRGSVAS